MSSILTNNGAMVALQTLKSINSNLGTIQSQISTGKNVSNAKDNAAVWAISKVMESDVKGFKGISDSLNLGESTVAVARSAAETVTDLLTQMKGKIVAAQEENVDRSKIQADIGALRGQIASVTGAAQFNGLNLLSDRATTVTYAGNEAVNTGTINVLSSLDRSSTGVVSAQISVQKQDLSTTSAKAGTLTLAATAFTAAGTATASGAASATYTISGETATAGRAKSVLAGDTYSFDMTIFDAGVPGTPFASLTTASKKTAVYTAKDGDTTSDIAKGMTDMVNFRLAEQGLQTNYTVTVANNVMSVKNNNTTALTAAAAGNITTTGGGTVSGGLAIVSEIDVSTKNGAAAALGAIEGLIQTSINSASAFGSAQGRIETQTAFIGNLTNSLKSGIGTLVDADMEEASARLQALQVQQQLGVQALSIANQAPQSLLSLFR